MQILQRLAKSTHLRPVLLLNIVPRSTKTISSKLRSTKSTRGDDEWNDAWETAWLPDDLAGKEASPWESDVNFGLSSSGRDDGRPTPNMVPPAAAELDAETKAFVEEMNENWAERKKGSSAVNTKNELERVEGAEKSRGQGGGLYSLDNVRKDYRLKKQRVHAGLWVKEIEKLEEARLGGNGGGGDDIEKLLDSCSDIFDSPSGDFGHSEVPSSSSSEIRNRPDGWESTAREQDGSIWDMTQREEDILLQEFDRRMAFCKFQIASFIKTHIFSRRRPIDGWKYMIEEIGPNARRGKGSVSRLPSLSDPATQPFKEEIQAADSSHFPSLKGR